MEEQKSSEEPKIVKTIPVCYCGTPECNNHYYRHVFNPTTTIKITENNTLIIDAKEYKEELETDKCQFPQCGAAKMLHGTIFKGHEFQPTTVKYRKIGFELPNFTPCYHCQTPLHEHKGKEIDDEKAHHFTVDIKILDRGEKDKIWFTSSNETQIQWFGHETTEYQQEKLR